MKKILCVSVALLLALGLAACDAPTTATSPSSPSDADMPVVVTFADPVLEAMVRATMGKPDGGITVAEAEAVKRLSLSTEWQRYISQETSIKDIGGLESFTNLESLDLSFHAITDITPLTGLKKLTTLALGSNPVADIAPLAGLTSLQVLSLSGCAARDYSPLAKLANLEVLVLDHATIADVSPLASLTKLKHLYLADSPINNYFPLSDIYQNLEQKDFTIAFTLAELGFTMKRRQQSGELWGRSVRRVEREHQPRRVGRSAV
ncbi:MAG: leucine-rich repeat domain-containing protein [Caldicoprobacterales bacterium]